MTDTVASMPAGLLIGNPVLQVSKADVPARLSLRARGDLSALNDALGLSLPQKIGTIVKKGAVEVLCLGPDEWVILAPDASPAITALASVYDSHPHSLTDISAREVTFAISGVAATDMFTIACPRDPESIPVGEGRRTVFDGTAVVLWRDGETDYRIDVWNSFAPHLMHLFDVAARELAAERALAS